MSSRSRPVAVCPSCGAYCYENKFIDTRCNAPETRGRCDGRWQKRTRLSDWVSCRTCEGSGYVETKRCQTCRHSGWMPNS